MYSSSSSSIKVIFKVIHEQISTNNCWYIFFSESYFFSAQQTLCHQDSNRYKVDKFCWILFLHIADALKQFPLWFIKVGLSPRLTQPWPLPEFQKTISMIDCDLNSKHGSFCQLTDVCLTTKPLQKFPHCFQNYKPCRHKIWIFSIGQILLTCSGSEWWF